MIRLLGVGALGVLVLGCGSSTEPLSRDDARHKCQAEVEVQHHVREFADEVSVELEDDLWTVSGTTVLPHGDYSCTIVVSTGKVLSAGAASY